MYDFLAHNTLYTKFNFKFDYKFAIITSIFHLLPKVCSVKCSHLFAKRCFLFKFEKSLILLQKWINFSKTFLNRGHILQAVQMWMGTQYFVMSSSDLVIFKRKLLFSPILMGLQSWLAMAIHEFTLNKFQCTLMKIFLKLHRSVRQTYFNICVLPPTRYGRPIITHWNHSWCIIIFIK